MKSSCATSTRTLIKAASAQEALELLLKHDSRSCLIDVCMPELDGFELAAMIREHPRFQKTAIIFISAVSLETSDSRAWLRHGGGRLRAGAGHSGGAAGQGPGLCRPLPQDAPARAAQRRSWNSVWRIARQSSRLRTSRLLESEQRRSLALAAGQMGAWDWDVVTGECLWDEGQYGIFGEDDGFHPTFEEIRRLDPSRRSRAHSRE